MAIGPFEYLTANSTGVLLMARDEPMLVEAIVPNEAIDAFFALKDPSADERQRLVRANLERFSHIAAGKYERGELNYVDVASMRVAHIRVSLFDLSAAGRWPGKADDRQTR